MNKIITLLTIATLAIISCNQKTAIEIKAEIEQLNGLLAKYDAPSEFYKFTSDSVVKVIGKKGTVITINPVDLMTENGKQISNIIEVELKEICNQHQMFLSNTQTVSNGKILVSGGAYFINIKSQGQQVKLKPQKTLKVEFPKLVKNKMSLFYGKRDSLGQLNWDADPKTFKNKKNKNLYYFCSEEKYNYCCNGNHKKLTKEEADLADKLYDEIELSNLGWINCDRFLEIKNKTNLNVNFAPSTKISTANIFLIFKDINSIMQTYHINENGKEHNSIFKNIPKDANVRLIAYTLKDNKIFIYSSDITIKENETLTLEMKETSAINFKTLLNNN